MNRTVYMGPCIKWPKSQGESPVCTGSCAYGWTQLVEPRTGLWHCAACLKPSHAYLRECDACEEIYLPEPEILIAIQANEEFRYNLMHSECAEILGD